MTSDHDLLTATMPMPLRPQEDAAEVLSLLRKQAMGAWEDCSPKPELDNAELEATLRLTDSPQSTEEPRVWYLRKDLMGVGFSLLFHMLLIVLLALVFLPRRSGDGPLVLEGFESGPTIAELDLQDLSLAIAEDLNQQALQLSPLPEPELTLASTIEVTSIGETSLQIPQIETTPVDQMAEGGGGLAGRAAERRADLVKLHGGNDNTELAVDMGLDWLARHQWPDGGWSFRHPPASQSRNAGNSASRSAATGLALLCFLGRNHHHVAESQYQQVVLNGLDFLLKTSKNGDLTQLTEHSMYGQGIATVALAEAYALSGDPALREPTQQAVQFIVDAQHPLGGWRYMPGQLGDINVTGWQWMALKTARVAGLDVPDDTMQRAIRFVDSQSMSPGAFFTYPGLDPNVPQPVPTAIGLLIRLHQGWGPRRDEIQMGLDYLTTQRISANHIYFNYYATMVLFHAGGPLWKGWNEELRDFLLNTQSDRGHERGSWFFPHAKTGNEGGRLYCTAMAVLILEVYYRHLRLYDESILLRDFPLD